MAEYIEREAAMDIVKRTSGDYATAWAELRKLPAADVEPVVHGRWVHDPASSYRVNIWFCSACNGEATRKYNHCPSCGAKMDGGKKDAN